MASRHSLYLGGPIGIRTHDLRNASAALFRLSYRRSSPPSLVSPTPAVANLLPAPDRQPSVHCPGRIAGRKRSPLHWGFAYFRARTGGVDRGRSWQESASTSTASSCTSARCEIPLPLAGLGQAEPRLGRRPSRRTTCAFGHPHRTRTRPPAPRRHRYPCQLCPHCQQSMH